ncbi:MAG: retroviral-like aspartic protease family protein, partial [Candidatus Thiodiazotropha endolucinida]|nr:retroviral-like aspartic protease family protein [Candidatus Thiodiazotropha taylori]MCW4264450.1 retroviral-like aspartic protease family protein [Candidatus Thiodiazotropha endolucinida]
MDELEQFRQVRPGFANDLDKFADLLDIAIINLKEAGQYHELEDGSLYTKLQRKLPEGMLARYHRWIFENQQQESVTALRTWVIQEAEFQTIAAETVHGFTGNERPIIRYKSQRTFFGDAKGNQAIKKLLCRVCNKAHGIWNCPTFMQYSVPDRWNLAKQNRLCYRCLGEGHLGKYCPRSRPCNQNGCKELHHRLLHDIEFTYQGQHPSDETMVNLSDSSQVNSYLTEEPVSSFTEGKQRTMVTQNRIRSDFVGLRTVPVVLKHGDRSLTVNALLDDASTKTYVNADVAAELGLKGKTEKVTVNVLNGQVETFETRPLDVELGSVDGNVSVYVSAYTANRVTGSMTVVAWNEYKMQWPHLKNISFPQSSSRPIVDVLIGLDCADLHCALKEVRGKPGEPVARLTPLGWTCIGNPEPTQKGVLQTNFACTYFVKDVSEIDQLNQNLKKFWEIESTSITAEPPVVRLEEQMALKKAKQSFTYEQHMYRVGVPWKSSAPDLPN